MKLIKKIIKNKKKIAKYILNTLSVISMLIAGINAIDGITIPYAKQIIEIIAVVNGVISSGLLSQKAVKGGK